MLELVLASSCSVILQDGFSGNAFVSHRAAECPYLLVQLPDLLHADACEQGTLIPCSMMLHDAP